MRLLEEPDIGTRREISRSVSLILFPVNSIHSSYQFWAKSKVGKDRWSSRGGKTGSEKASDV